MTRFLVRWALPITLSMFAFHTFGQTPALQTQHIRLEDSSDWWSLLRQDELPGELPDREPTRPIKVLKRKPAESHFQIAGVTLDKDKFVKDDSQEIRSRFGQAIGVQRGDAASGRDQICYVSPSGGIHLIFEVGEVDATVYLFQGGPKWQGSELCAASPELSASLSTASGLRLGLDLQQVKTLLGSPSLATSDKLRYFFSFKRKANAAELAELRRYYRDMSDRELHKNFDYVDVSADVEARFTSGKLTYLVISRSETN